MPMSPSARWTKTRSHVTATLPVDAERVRLLGRGLVVAELGRCVQCGICSQNCPSGIDVRAVAREGRAVTDRRCLLCGSCVLRCPRGTLSFQLLEAS
jgi:ferredoxin